MTAVCAHFSHSFDRRGPLNTLRRQRLRKILNFSAAFGYPCTGHVGEAGFLPPKGLIMGAAARSLPSPLSFNVVAITLLPLHPAGSEPIREDYSRLGESRARVKTQPA